MGNLSDEGFRLMVSGITRNGKSYWVKKKLLPVLEKRKPVIVFDRKGEYAGEYARDASKHWKGFSGVYPFFSHLQEKKKLTDSVYVINCQSDDDYIHGLNLFVTLRSPVSLVVDEAHDIFLDRELYSAKRYLTKATRYGAQFGIDVVLITQRPVDIPPVIRSQIKDAVIFNQTLPDDIKALESEYGPDAKKIIDLKAREFICFGVIPTLLKVDK